MLGRDVDENERPFSGIIVQTAVGDYRYEFVRHLRLPQPVSFEILAGERYFGDRVRTDFAGLGIGPPVANHFMLGERLLWQRGVIRPAVAADVAVVELNPRILNSWAVALLRRMTGRRTIVWGHLYSRSGEASRTNDLRLLLMKLAGSALMYTSCDSADLSERAPNLKVGVCANSLYDRDQIVARGISTKATDAVFVGRLSPDKRPRLVLEAWRNIEQPTAKLHVVGDGPERAELEREFGDLVATGNAVFHGHVSDIDRLRNLFHSAVFSVIPGFAGLALTQSLSFGVPCLVADDEPHAPEICAMKPGFNGDYFPARDSDALANAMQLYFDQREMWAQRADAIASECAAEYSTEAMVTGLMDLCAETELT